MNGDGDTRLAAPLWGIGAAVALWGLLRGRPLVFLIGAGAFFADSDAEPVRRVRQLVGLGEGPPSPMERHGE